MSASPMNCRSLRLDRFAGCGDWGLPKLQRRRRPKLRHLQRGLRGGGGVKDDDWVPGIIKRSEVCAGWYPAPRSAATDLGRTERRRCGGGGRGWTRDGGGGGGIGRRGRTERGARPFVGFGGEGSSGHAGFEGWHGGGRI
ncbi:unnamed protein product [Linum trigynum]|uniref:Uncharacterized protein n=1 Tax=Linum trigynum TaxID=586398 RepID=A0AAV2DSI0_9ROSI